MDTQNLASLFKALSEPVRVRLITLLLQRDELCVCDLVEAVGLSQSVVSRHLAYLRNQGLVIATRRGVWMYYRMDGGNRKALQPLWKFIVERTAEDAAVQDDLQRLKVNPARCN